MHVVHLIRQELNMDTLDILRELMSSNDINQSALARIAGSDDATVSLWFSGKRKPTLRHVENIAKYFGVSVDYLLGRPKYEYAFMSMPQSAPKKAYAPLLGRVHAGSKSEPDILDDAVPIPYEIWERHRDAILLEVEGDCMDKILPPGCLVLIDKTQEPRQGSIVVAAIDNEYIVRRYSCGASTLLLSPVSNNTEWQDLIITDDTVELVGVVVWYQPPSELE